MTNKAGENPRSSAEPLMPNPPKYSGAGRSEQPPTGNPKQSVVPAPLINHQLAKNQVNDQMIGRGSFSLTNVMGQSVLKTCSAISKSAGKRSLNTNTDGSLGLTAAQAFEKRTLGFPPIHLLPTQITPVLPFDNPSHLQKPVTLSPPPQVAKVPRNDVSGERSVQVESTCPAGQGSTYPPAAPNTGLSDS